MSSRERWTLIAGDRSAALRAAVASVLPAELFLVREAESVEQVVDLLKEVGGAAVVLVDVTLCSGLGAAECVQVMQQALPRVKVVFTTHRPIVRIKQALRDLPEVAVLRKPFRLYELRRALSSALSVAEATITSESQPEAKPERAPETAGEGVLTPQIAGDATFDLLFQELERRQPLEEGMDAFDVVEKHLIERALEACSGNQSRTARFLGITRNTLRKRIKKYGFSGALVDED